MTLFADLLPNLFMALASYWVLIILDQNNRFSWFKTGLFVLIYAMILCWLDYQFQIVFHPVEFLVSVLVYSMIAGRFRWQLAFDIVVVLCVEFLVTITISVIIYPLLGNILEARVLMMALILVINVMWILVLRSKLQKHIETVYKAHRNQIVVVCAGISVAVAIISYVWTYQNPMFWEQQWLLYPLFLLVYLLSMVVLFEFMKRYQQRERLKTYEEYGEYLEHMMDQLSRRQHEYYNQINTILGFTQTQEECAPAIEEYCRHILNEKNEERKETVIRGYGMVAAVLYRKEQQARAAGIHFVCDIEKPFPDFPLTTYELSEILVNMLNNAFEHVQELPEEKREVYLSITKGEIEVVNAINPETDLTFLQSGQARVSTKGHDRGIGLINIEEITNQHGGTMQVTLDSETIAFLVEFSTDK